MNELSDRENGSIKGIYTAKINVHPLNEVLHA
jgi:hypothetical protein